MASLSSASTRDRPCPPLRRRAGLLDLLTLYRQRRRLARLDAAALDDLGLTLRDARAEARRPLWDVPQHWLE